MTVEMNLQRGLVGHWTMNSTDVDSGVIRDRSGHGNLGQINGPVPHYPGNLSESFHWSGLGMSETIDSTGARVTDSFTISAWIYLEKQDTTSNNDWRGIIDSTSGSGTARILIEDQGAVSFRAHTGDNFIAGNIPSKEWKFITGVYDGSDRIVYVDGAEAARETIDTTGTAEDFTIGEDSSHNPLGLIDDVRVYNRALSQAEIEQLYNIRADRAYGSPHVPQRPVAAGDLVAWYPFEGEASDATAFQPWAGDDADYSGTVNGATHQETGGVTDIRHGTESATYKLDGSSNITTTVYPDTYFPFTASLWVKPSTSISNQKALLDQSSGGGWAIRTNSGDGSIEIFKYPGADILTSSTTLPANSWSHVVGCFDAGSLRIYYNGSQITSMNADSTINENDSELFIGSAVEGSYYLPGLIDDIRIYKKVLSQAEVEQIYTNTKP